MTIIDSCIVMDIAENGKRTAKAQQALKNRLRRGRLFAPDVVFSEVCYGYARVDEVEAIFADLQIQVLSLSKRSLFRASKAFERFLSMNKQAVDDERLAKRILPDFFVGAFAEEEGIPLLTRDVKRRWDRYFPQITVIEP